MAVRRVPEDHPDIQSAVDASAPGDRIEVAAGAEIPARLAGVVVTTDGLTIDFPFVMGGGAGFTLGPGVRSLALPGSGNFTATGNDLDNSIAGGRGTGYLYGRGGDDVLAGGPGADRMEGGTGNDTYEVDNTASGTLGRGPPAFIGDQVVERVDEGWDGVWASVDFTLPAHVEGLVLTGGARRGFGNEAGNLIVGNGEANVLAGLGGDDELRGAAGGDTYLVGGRGDRVVEEASASGEIDEVLATVDHELPAEVENLTLLGGAVWGSGNGGANLINGNERDNRLLGWAGNDTLIGGGGDDELRGDIGDDTYFVDGRGDRVVEEGTRFPPFHFGTDQVLATTDYELPANVENLTLLEGTAAVWGAGNELDNRIIGNERDNRLVGWEGNDTLTGGAGDDVFFLVARPSATITDFWPGAGSDDRLAFSRDLFSSREEAFAAARQTPPGGLQGVQDVWINVPGLGGVTLQNTRLADLTLDDIVIV